MKDSDKVKDILSKKNQLITKDYRDKYGLTGCGIGYKITNGKKTEKEALVFFVDKKKSLNELTEDKILPSTIDDIDCDVVEMEPLVAQTLTSKIRPAAPGYSCGHYLVTAGTLGCVAYKGSNRYILSNNHVLANTNAGSIGDAIRQPGTADGGTSSDVVAYLDSFVTLANNVKSDAALAIITDNSLVTDVGQWGYSITSYSTPSLGNTIYKTGRTTETTSAEITYVHTGVNCTYSIGTIYIDDCFLTDNMSAAGDSGSVGRSNNSNAVGLLFSGNDTITAYCYMSNVISELGGFTFFSTSPEATYTSRYPTTYDGNHVNATTLAGSGFDAFLAADPSKSLIGASENNSYQGYNTGNSSQVYSRIHIDLGAEYIIKRIYYENYHNSGGDTTRGLRAFTFWGSNTANAFSTLTYGTDTDWTQLTTDISELVAHTAVNQAEPEYVLVNNSTAYRYYAIKPSTNWGFTYLTYVYYGIRRFELQTQDAASTLEGDGSNVSWWF